MRIELASAALVLLDIFWCGVALSTCPADSCPEALLPQTPFPDISERRQDIWLSPDTPHEWRADIKDDDVEEAALVAEPLPGLRVVVLNTANWAPNKLPGCLPGWSAMKHTNSTVKDMSYQCYYTKTEYWESAKKLLEGSFYSSVLRNHMGVDARECKMTRGLYAIRYSMDHVVDEYHDDAASHAPDSDKRVRSYLKEMATGCAQNQYHWITFLAYPHHEWEPAWEGHTEFAALNCSHPASGNRNLGPLVPPALRVAPMPRRTVVFHGRLQHRAAVLSEAFKNDRYDGHDDGKRFSVVARFRCNKQTTAFAEDDDFGEEDYY